MDTNRASRGGIMRTGLRVALWGAVALTLLGMAGCNGEDIASIPEATIDTPPCSVPLAAIPNASGTTPMSAACNGSYFFTVSGGTPTGVRFARYLADGSVDATYSPGIDFRAIVTDRQGNLYAKAYGPTGTVYSVSPGMVFTALYDLNDPNPQAKIAFNAYDSELYTRNGATVRRYRATDGSFVGSFTLLGMTAAETAGPDDVQIATGPNGFIYTFSDGVVSRWNLNGVRLGSVAVPIATPLDFDTGWSFSLAGNGRAYLYEASSTFWRSYGP